MKLDETAIGVRGKQMNVMYIDISRCVNIYIDIDTRCFVNQY